MADYDRIRALVTEFEERRKSLYKELEGSFGGLFKEFLELNPEIDYITWSQYTPYFNDGDECVFSRNNSVFMVKGWNEEDETQERPVGWHAEDTDFGVYYSRYNAQQSRYPEILVSEFGPERAREIYENIGELEEALETIPDDVYKSILGDHVGVIVDRAGVHTDEYDHD